MSDIGVEVGGIRAKLVQLQWVNGQQVDGQNGCGFIIWAKEPRHQGLVTITYVETPPPPQEETAPENPLTSQGPLFRLGMDLNP
ncbi:hypothetical protein R6Q59_003677 [Mikania micrantha]